MSARRLAVLGCDWCGQGDHDPIKPTDSDLHPHDTGGGR